MSFPRGCLLCLLGCQGASSAGGSAGGAGGSAAELVVAPIVLRAQSTSATVLAGPPCRATVDGTELIVGFGPGPGRTLVAQLGTARWTTEDASNGTTFLRDDRAVARIHAKQLFDEQGAPVIRLLDNGDIVNGPGRIVRHAKASGDVATQSATVTITPDVNPGQPADPFIVTGTTNIELAAMLSARETTVEIRALAACHYLMPESVPAEPRAP